MCIHSVHACVHSAHERSHVSHMTTHARECTFTLAARTHACSHALTLAQPSAHASARQENETKGEAAGHAGSSRVLAPAGHAPSRVRACSAPLPHSLKQTKKAPDFPNACSHARPVTRVHAPERTGYRPVRKAARLGVHRGEAASRHRKQRTWFRVRHRAVTPRLLHVLPVTRDAHGGHHASPARSPCPSRATRVVQAGRTENPPSRAPHTSPKHREGKESVSSVSETGTREGTVPQRRTAQRCRVLPRDVCSHGGGENPETRKESVSQPRTPPGLRVVAPGRLFTRRCVSRQRPRVSPRGLCVSARVCLCAWTRVSRDHVWLKVVKNPEHGKEPVSPVSPVSSVSQPRIREGLSLLCVPDRVKHCRTREGFRAMAPGRLFTRRGKDPEHGKESLSPVSVSQPSTREGLGLLRVPDLVKHCRAQGGFRVRAPGRLFTWSGRKPRKTKGARVTRVTARARVYFQGEKPRTREGARVTRVTRVTPSTRGGLGLLRVPDRVKHCRAREGFPVRARDVCSRGVTGRRLAANYQNGGGYTNKGGISCGSRRRIGGRERTRAGLPALIDSGGQSYARLPGIPGRPRFPRHGPRAWAGRAWLPMGGAVSVSVIKCGVWIKQKSYVSPAETKSTGRIPCQGPGTSVHVEVTGCPLTCSPHRHTRWRTRGRDFLRKIGTRLRIDGRNYDSQDPERAWFRPRRL
ncbi:hypothetical protein NN561_019935 [Cricetulus griseus]